MVDTKKIPKKEFDWCREINTDKNVQKLMWWYREVTINKKLLNLKCQ
jgi:hypothetical protein